MDYTPERRKALIDSIPEVTFDDNENIQPRRQGRSVAALNRISGMSATERKEAIEAGHSRFNEQLQTISYLDDPLSIYIEHLTWLFEMYPDGSAKDEITEVLHNATNTFSTDPDYKSDLRYLKLWLEYTNYVDQPLEIFKFLIRNHIGQTLGLFYEAYSSLLETHEQYNQAIQVYEMGIEKKVKSSARLKKNLNLLKARIEARKQRGLIKEREDKRAQINALKKTGNRTMLGQKFDAHSMTSMPSNVFSGIQSMHGSSSSQRQSSFGNSGYIKPAHKSPKIIVFKDEPASSSSRPLSIRDDTIATATTATATATSTTSTPTTPTAPNKSQTIFQPTIAASQQHENKYTAESFKDVVIPQADFVRPVVERFTVYRDEPLPKKTIERQNSSMYESSGDESTIARTRRLTTNDSPVRSTVKKTSIEILHRKKMEEHFKRNERYYLKSKSTKGKYEMITVLKGTHARSCFEEERIYRLGIEYEKPIDTTEDEFEIYHRRTQIVTPEVGYTTETRKAIESVEQQFYGDKPNLSDEDITWSSPYQRLPIKKKKISNENENE